MAASLSKFASSAPLAPGVMRARRARSASGPSGIPRRATCRRRIASRPSTVGSGTATIRSKRPGRVSAGSSSSGRLVAPITTTPSVGEKPSISTRSWFSVRSSSLCDWLRPRRAPSTSSSSMKITPPLRRAFLNSVRIRCAPRPTRNPVTSEPEMAKNGTPASPATARASSVLPVPGGPTSRMPLGTRAPSAANADGCFRNSTTSRSSSAAPCVPATSANVVTLPSLRRAAFALPPCARTCMATR